MYINRPARAFAAVLLIFLVSIPGVFAQDEAPIDPAQKPIVDVYGPADQRGGNGLTDVEELFARDGTLRVGPYMGVEANEEQVYDQIGFAAGYGSGLFGVGFDMMLINDDRYTPAEPYMFGHYFRMNEGIVSVAPEPFTIRAGRIDHRDEVETPYSLFISSRDLPATVADVEYNDGFFFYRTRWISLNRNWDYEANDMIPPNASPDQIDAIPRDRGANYKAYGLQFGNWRLGVQESVVYINQEFYPEYFFSPLPMYFTQLVNSSTGKPWTQQADENSIIGLFLDYETPQTYAYVQFLMDDVNLRALAPGVNEVNPNKLAWSFGGRHAFDFGTLGLYHAGATKYTYAATTTQKRNDVYSTKPYEYAYYPAVTYGDETLWYDDNYIGYQYGENNLAFMFTYDRAFPQFDLGGSLEYVISGSKSPANPWHEDYEADATQLLSDDPKNEHTIRLGGEITRRIDNWHLTAAGSLGYRFNALELNEVTDEKGLTDPNSSPAIFRPTGGDLLLGSLFLGARYQLSIDRDTTWDTLFLPEGATLEEVVAEEEAAAAGPAAYEITEVEYAIDGRTREFALAGKLDIEEGTTFASREELEAYIVDKRQELLNQRELQDTSTLEYVVRPRDGRPDAVVISVDAEDTFNVIALPYPRYDSNDGLLLGLRLRDYNFFGTMETLSVDLDYENKIGEQDRLSGNEVWTVATDFSWPFRWQGHDWNWRFKQGLQFESRTDIEYELDTSLDYDFLIGRRTFTATYSQGYEYLTDDSKGDGYFLTSGLGLGTSYDTGWELPVMGELAYKPAVFTDVTYKLGDSISDDRRAIEPGFRQSLSGGNVDWIGNFREGLRGTISNSNSVNLGSVDGKDIFDRNFEAELAGYLELDPFAFSGRGLIEASLDDNEYANASPLRGILDDRIEGDVGAYFNADITLKVFTLRPLVEGQGSFFFDAGAVVDLAKGFRPDKDIKVAGGIEAIGFPLFARSLFMRASLGFDLERLLLNRDLSAREIFIGLGHHY